MGSAVLVFQKVGKDLEVIRVILPPLRHNKSLPRKRRHSWFVLADAPLSLEDAFRQVTMAFYKLQMIEASIR